MHVVAFGNPFDGVGLVGPFADAETAGNYAEGAQNDYWIVELAPPPDGTDGHLPAPELLDALKNLVVEIGTLCTEYCLPETELQAEVPSFVEAVNRADELLGRLRANE